MLELLKNEIIKYYMEEEEKLKKEEKNVIISCYGTFKTATQYKNGELEEEKAYKRAIKSAINENKKYRNKSLLKIAEAENAEELEYIRINVDWVRNRTWGYNPKVEIWTNCGYYTGSASGCGYDKESSAIAEALNSSPEVMKKLYELAEKMLKEVGDIAYKSELNCISWRNSIGYGSGYSIRPYFEGGVGIGCFERILNKMGYLWHNTGSGKHWDCYNITKKGE
jgi:hypothetical protein